VQVGHARAIWLNAHYFMCFLTNRLRLLGD